MIDYNKNRRALASAPRRLIAIDDKGIFRFEYWRAFTLAEMAMNARGRSTMQIAYNSLCERIGSAGKILNTPEQLIGLGINIRAERHGAIPIEPPTNDEQNCKDISCAS